MQTKKNEVNQIEKIERLRFALSNQIEWQKYAEGKNLMFLTVSAGTLVFIYGGVDASKKESLEFVRNLNWFYLFFIFTSIISFFIAVTSLRLIIYKTVYPKKVSLISWDYVRRKTRKELKTALDEYNDDIHIEDLIVQHLYGSKLTHRKYLLFTIGMIIYSLGIMSLIIDFLIRIFNLKQ